MRKMLIADNTNADLAKLATQNEAILVAYSGGKDSRVVLDLCSKTFGKVVCFYLYLVPGLKFIEDQLQWAINRYKVDILQYAGMMALPTILKYGIYCDPSYEYEKFLPIKEKDEFDIVRNDTGITLIANGQRKSEGIHRRKNMSRPSKNVIYPIKNWNKFEVLSYCKAHDIPLPDALRKDMSGVNLEDKTLCWLYDQYPQDFARLLQMFPYAEVPIYRRKFYGV